MKIAELFVDLGVKGGDQTQNTLKGVKGGMNQVKSSSIAAKAAIIAAIYGLQRLTTASMNAGVAQTQFSNLTGLSTKKLQQWQHANKMAGGSAEEVTGVVTSMQQAFAQLQLGEGPAKYLGLFAEGLERVGESLDPEQMRDSFYTLEKFRAFVKGGGSGNVGIDNEIGASLGISQGIIAGSRGGLFDDSILNRARIVSDRQAKEAMRIKAMWTDLGDTIEKEIGKLNTQFGGKLVKDLTDLVKQFAFLTAEIIKMSNEMGVFDRLSTAIQNLANLLDLVRGITQELNAAGNPEVEQRKSEESTMSQFGNGIKEIYGGLWNALASPFSHEDSLSQSQTDANLARARMIAPSMAGMNAQLPSSKGTNSVINQTQNFYGPTEPKKVGIDSYNGIKSAATILQGRQ